MKHDVRLAALIVNYNTGSYAECCVESLLAEWKRAGRAREKLAIVLVDNASPQPQDEYLRRLEALGVTVIRSRENLGYARGMNLCYAQTSGAPGDVVAILNPDLYFLPGAVELLLDYVLDHPEVGVVDPATSVDPLGVINLPPNVMPTPLDHARVVLANMHPFFARAYSRYREARCMRWWTSREPLETDMLSGCCMFMRRAVIDELGQVLDPRYPLYFEDTDLFRTLAQKGYKVVHHTPARILHHWSRSAMIGGAPGDQATLRHELSRELYYRKFYGPLGRGFYRVMQALLMRWPKRWLGRPIQPMVSLGALHEPLELELPRACRFRVEMSVHPSFVVCSGSFGRGERWSIPAETWDWMFSIDYYARVYDLDTHEVLGAYQFQKTKPCRSEAMKASELEQLGPRLLEHAPFRWMSPAEPVLMSDAPG
ncbi:MAG: glycosyltransferase family 2 protein [Planctomycetes bacterium]|nr:glycosyltransferase family 2 protein [Planctomycetota bacterium]